MAPETYLASTKEGLAHAARMIQQLGTVAFITFLVALIAWGCWRFGPELVGLVNRCLACGGEAFRASARYPFVGRMGVTGVAFGSLVAGVVAGVFQLDERWRTQRNRFWCLSPEYVEAWLRTGRLPRSDAERIRDINKLAAYGSQARRAIPILTDYLSHPSARVASAARAALTRIGTTPTSEGAR